MQGSFMTEGSDLQLGSVTPRKALFDFREPRTVYVEGQILYTSCVDLDVHNLSPSEEEEEGITAHLSTGVLYRPPFVFYDTPFTNASRYENFCVAMCH